MTYLKTLLSVLFLQPGLFDKALLLLAYFFGIGMFSDYEKVRDQINSWQHLFQMPAEFPTWLVPAPLFVWIIIMLAHQETKRRLHAARLEFDRPFVDANVPLFGPGRDGQRQLIDSLEIAKVCIRNRPYDLRSGRSIDDAWVNVTIFEEQTGNKVFSFDYPRWEDNPKPGYQGNPADHFPTDWNRRALKPNGERSAINFALKSYVDDDAFGFRGRSQLDSRWQSKDLRFGPGRYLVRLIVSGSGLAKEADKWIALENLGRGRGLRVAEATPPRTVLGR